MSRLPKPNRNIILSFILLSGIVFSGVKIAFALTPSPGHSFTESSGGIATGDLIYGSAADVFSALADVATGNALISGGVGLAPSWGKIGLTTHVSGILPTANGGTANEFFTVAGPAAAAKTFTFPNADATILTSNSAVTVAQGGTGAATLNDAGVLIGNNGGAVQVTGAGTTGQVLTSNGAGVDPTFQTVAGGNDPRIILKALNAQQDSSSVTPAKVTGLDQAAGTGTYVFQYFIRYRSSATATGVKFDVNHSGTVTSFVWNQRWADASATASTNTPDQDAVIAAGQVMGSNASRDKGTAGRGTTLSVDTVDADMLMIIEGLMVVTVSGNLELYFGSEATGSTQSIMADSSLILTKIQ